MTPERGVRPISCASTHVFGDAMQAEHIYPHIRHRDEEEGVFAAWVWALEGRGGLAPCLNASKVTAQVRSASLASSSAVRYNDCASYFAQTFSSTTLENKSIMGTHTLLVVYFPKSMFVSKHLRQGEGVCLPTSNVSVLRSH